jgi:hypothetical protein
LKTIKGLTEEDKVAVVAVLEQPIGETTIKDIRALNRVCKCFESSGDVNMEDADHAYMMARLGKYTGWNPAGRKDIIRVLGLLEIE